MSACALFIIGITTRWRAIEPARPAATAQRRRRRRAPVAEHARRRRRRRAPARRRRQRPAVSAGRARTRRRWKATRSSRVDAPRPPRPSLGPAGRTDGRPGTAAPSALRWRDRRVVLVLPDGRDRLAVARRDLACGGKRRPADHVGESAHDRLEILRRGTCTTATADGASRRRVSDMPRPSSASAMSSARPRCRAAVDDARDEVAPARAIESGSCRFPASSVA